MMDRERLKRKKEDELEKQRLAEVFEDFRESFESSKSQSKVSFVRGGTVNSGHRDRDRDRDRDRERERERDHHRRDDHNRRYERYSPESSTSVFADAIKKATESAQRLKSQNSESKSSSSSSNVSRPPRPGKSQSKPKVSNLEMFKEELKMMQEKRQVRKDERERELQQQGISGEELTRLKSTITNPYLDDNYSEFSENLNTTNLYISYLPLKTTMEELYDTFGSFGPLASARILYPRGNEHRQYMFAFVAYMSRKDAERALNAMNGAELNGSDIRVNWGRDVEIPEIPHYIPAPLRALALPDAVTGLPFNARPRQCDLQLFLQKWQRLPDLKTPASAMNAELRADYQKMLRNSVVRVVIPTERSLLKLIHRMVEYIVREGPQFEAAIMAREVNNPLFRFLYENTQPSHTYYRWRLFAVLQGDDLYEWRIDRFRMYDEGSWWEPPPYKLFSEMPVSLYHTAYVPMKRDDLRQQRRGDVERERREQEFEHMKRRRGALSDDDRNFLEQLLRKLTPKRRHVGFAMAWCLRRGRYAKEIIECIVEALMIPETPLFKKLGRFYLLSDILANCEIQGPEVANFRLYIEPKLEATFIEFNKIFKRIPTRINQSQFRTRVASCIQLWNDNAIYPKSNLMHYQNIFYGLSDDFDHKKPKNADSDEASKIKNQLLSLQNSPSNADDGNEEMEIEDQQEQTPPKPVAMNFKAQDEWVALDLQQEQEQQPQYAMNRWESDDFNCNGYQPMMQDTYSAPIPMVPSQKSGFGGINIKLESNTSEVKSASGKSSDEKRKILRDIEAKVVLFQDELEESKDPFMQEKVDEYREQLLQKADLMSFASAETKMTELERVQTVNRRQQHSGSRDREYYERGRDHDRERRRRPRSRSRSRSRDRYNGNSGSYRSSGSHRY